MTRRIENYLVDYGVWLLVAMVVLLAVAVVLALADPGVGASANDACAHHDGVSRIDAARVAICRDGVAVDF